MMRKKFSLLRCSAIAGCALLAAVAFGGCKGNDGDLSRKVYHYGDSYELVDGQIVIFYVDPYTNGNDGKRVYLRLTDVYLNVTTSETTGEGSLMLEGNSSPTIGMRTYRYEFEDGATMTQQWIAPFTNELKSDAVMLNLLSYRYYKLTATNCNVQINEVVFYGEQLTASSGEPTGEYCLVPTKIYSATPAEGETQEKADERAGALIDRQTTSFKQISKLKESEE